jgi:muconate/chloromuconate cycloisomerase
MQIADVRPIPLRVPLKQVFKAAYGTRRTADFVVVEIETHDGLVGLGEASPIPIYDEGNQAGIVYVVNNYFKPLLLGQDPRQVVSLRERLDQAVTGERYAKCAVEFALWDLAGKIYGLPVYALLGGKAREVQVCWVFSGRSPEEIEEEAAAKYAEGFRVFKLKVGMDGKVDVANAAAARRAIGSEAELRLDGNGAWGAKEALRRIEGFIPYNPAHIEQPVPAQDLEGLGYVRRHCPIPVVADECVLTPYDAMRVAKTGAADMVNIKISRAGGIIPAQHICAVATAAGQPPLVGSMLELGLGTVVSAHFAASVPGLARATELVGPLLLERDILAEPLEYHNGYLVLPPGPGFGVRLAPDALKEFRVNLD